MTQGLWRLPSASVAILLDQLQLQPPVVATADTAASNQDLDEILYGRAELGYSG